MLKRVKDFTKKSEWVNNKRNLDITVDGVHLNMEGAKGLEALIIEENK